MKVPILDHGYLEFVECWGSDERIIEAARMSTDKGFQGWGPIPCKSCGGTGNWAVKQSIDDGYGEVIDCPNCSGEGWQEGDEKLLRYLWENKHATPFEMAGAIFEVQAPIFVFREWHRHRTQSYNELSARYTELPDLCYIPSKDRLLRGGQSSSNKQGAGVELDPIVAQCIEDTIRASYTHARQSYRNLLDSGVARELARLVIPVGQYSRMRASANLRNWFAFLSLREAPGAQWEIRQYANALHELLASAFPRSVKLFEGPGS